MRPLAIGTFIKLQSNLTSYVPPPRFIRGDLRGSAPTYVPRLVRGIQGFTLIEILIVLVIIGISFSFALLAFGDFGKSRQAQSTAEQVKNMIQYFREQAIIESSNFTINIRNRSYQVSRADANAEGKLPSSPQISSGTFSKDISLSPATSFIEIHSSGSITPFTLTFGTPSHPRVVNLIGDANGQLKLQPL
jgi:general secretion pathway protein H